jgi:anti-sigma regulatory factor (Ser/Thr protein kinase)
MGTGRMDPATSCEGWRDSGASSKATEALLAEARSFWGHRHVESLGDLRGELRRFFEQRAIPARVCDDLILAAQEACNNACLYGTDGMGCDLAVSFADGTVTIEVADRGPGFDLDAVKATWPPALLEAGGRGLFLIAELADQIEVVRRRRGMLVRIFKAVE